MLGDLDDLVDDLTLGADDSPPIAASAQALRYGKTNRFEGSHGRKKLIDLKRPGKATLNPSLGSHMGDVSPSIKICPDVGLRTPVRRLMNVVLPAPFGPIRA